jgi:hypothetical protein
MEVENAVRRRAEEPGELPMTQYLLSVYQPDGPIPSADVLGPIMQKVETVRNEMKSAGAWVFSGGLHPASSATVVRFQNGDVITTDGPFAESKEHVGGFTIVKAPHLDAALEWARKLSRATTLPIEVRPFRDSGCN